MLERVCVRISLFTQGGCRSLGLQKQEKALDIPLSHSPNAPIGRTVSKVLSVIR